MPPTYFMIKHKFNKIPQYSLVTYVTRINTYCLVEEYLTKEREWVSEYDIYPLHDYYVSGAWTYDATYDNLVPSTYYHLFKK